MRRSWARSGGAGELNGDRQIVSCEQAKCFEILLAGYSYNIIGKRRGGWTLVPIECLKIIAHELFVERGLRSSRRVRVPRPEPGRIGRQRFIHKNGQKQLSISQAELELGVANDDATRLGVLRGLAVDLQADLFEPSG